MDISAINWTADDILLLSSLLLLLLLAGPPRSAAEVMPKQQAKPAGPLALPGSANATPLGCSGGPAAVVPPKMQIQPKVACLDAVKMG